MSATASIMLVSLFLALVTSSMRPSQPAVGDPVTLQFSAPVVLDPSNAYEVVSRRGNSIVVRTFEPRPFVVSGHAGAETVRVEVPVRSVLKPKEQLKPAPLKPPEPDPAPRMPLIAIGVASLIAVLAWLVAVLLARRRSLAEEIVVVPGERYRAVVASLRADRRGSMRWARLADATRTYLAGVDARYGSDLTTSEILGRVPDSTALREILRQGDLEKFSPWGPAVADFDVVADRALQIISWAEAPAAEGEAA